MTVYISGPISGMRGNNKRSFTKAERKLKKELPCANIINPQNIARKVDGVFDEMNSVLSYNLKPAWHDYMAACITELLNCTHVLLLRGWEKSRGANIERNLALGLGMYVTDSVGKLKNFLRKGGNK